MHDEAVRYVKMKGHVIRFHIDWEKQFTQRFKEEKRSRNAVACCLNKRRLQV